MKSIFVLGINGSPYHDGIVSELLNLVLNGAKQAGADIKVINLYDLKNIVHTPGNYSKDPRSEVPDKMPQDDIVAMYPEIVRADCLVLATPVYWVNMSGIMKEFIDHLTPLENSGSQLEGKVAAFIAASKENEGGQEMAVMSMVTALSQMGVLIPPNAIMWHPGKWSTAENITESWAKEDAPKVGRNIVTLTRILQEQPINWSK